MKNYLQSTFIVVVVTFLSVIIRGIQPFNFQLPPPSPPNITVYAYDRYGGFSRQSNSPPRNSTVKIDNKNGSVVTVPWMTKQVVIECTGPNPVQWNLVESKLDPEVFPNIQVNARRYSEDVFDPTSHNYSTQLILGGHADPHKFTGNFTCQNAEKRHVQSYVYMFWESEGDETLVRSEETVKVYLNHENVVTLPCMLASKMGGPPTLKKFQGRRGAGNFSEIHPNKSITFERTKGFTLTNLSYPLGVYRCVGLEDEHDVVTTIVRNATKKPTRSPKASLSFDTQKHQLVCCSGGKRPPLVSVMHCNHPVTCQFREHIVEPFHYIFSNTKKEKNCARKSVRFWHTALARCIGEGIDEYKELIAPVGITRLPWIVALTNSSNIVPFFSWSEIDPQEMLVVEIRNSTRRRRRRPPTPQPFVQPTLYANQPVRASCIMSHYYFAEGNRWGIRYKNKTLQIVKNPKMSYRSRYMTHSDTLKITLDLNMESLICFAPVWNSSSWVWKTQFLYVNETTKPTLVDNKTLEFTWTTNQTSKEMKCEGQGAPDPDFMWKLGNMTITNLTHNYNLTTFKANNTNIVTSILKVLRVSPGVQGNFSCSAVNFGGKATKLFTVKVISPATSAWATITLCIVGGVLSVLLVAGLLLVWWKIRVDQGNMPTMPSLPVAIRQKPSSSSAPPTNGRSNGNNQLEGMDAVNAAYDSGRMTNQLIITD